MQLESYSKGISENRTQEVASYYLSVLFPTVADYTLQGLYGRDRTSYSFLKSFDITLALSDSFAQVLSLLTEIPFKRPLHGFLSFIEIGAVAFNSIETSSC